MIRLISTGIHGLDMIRWVSDHALAALIDLLPENRKIFEDRHEVLVDRIDTLFAIEEDLAPLSGQSVFVYQPFDISWMTSTNEVAVETGGKEPTAKDLASLIELAKRERPKAIFVQKQFPVSSAQTVADAVGSAVVPLDPLAYDWLDNIRAIGNALVESGGRK